MDAEDSVGLANNINISLAHELISKQFPHWAHLPIVPTKYSGWDNKTFRLGEELLIRMPSAERYASQVNKEQHWLPILALKLSLQIPEPIASGSPSVSYPWDWSIYKWIKGDNLSLINTENNTTTATDLAQFLLELHKIPTIGGPVARKHNFYRGGSLRVYDSETRQAIDKLNNTIDVNTSTQIWERALESQWQNKSVWIHGDFTADNILQIDGKVVAVIDFGGIGVGDPACDLVIAWNYFSGESRKKFKSILGLDQDTWHRAMGWALWKALIVLADFDDSECSGALKIQSVIDKIMDEYILDNENENSL